MSKQPHKLCRLSCRRETGDGSSMRYCSAGSCPFNSNHVYLQLVIVRVTACGVSTLQTGKQAKRAFVCFVGSPRRRGQPAKAYQMTLDGEAIRR